MKTRTYIAVRFAPDAPWQMSKARRRVSRGDGSRDGHGADASWQMSTRR